MNSVVKSEISNYYKRKSLLITGATGFVGKVLVEKLLRSCTDLKRIYVLVRPKKGQDASARLNDLFNFKLFDQVKATIPNIHEKVIPINGDLVEPNLGLSEADSKRLCKDVNIILHSAATVKFNEPLKVAVNINVAGVQRMIDLAKKMDNLESFTHVSTAYSNCDRHEVDEKVYDPPMKPFDAMKLCEILDEDQRNVIEAKLIKGRPNTYTWSKAIAESLVMEHQKELPMSIVRPSIVGATFCEPFPGWVDNLAAGTGVLAFADKGLLSSMIGHKHKIIDCVPVDTVVNMIIAAAWYRGMNYTKDTLVYNNTSGAVNPLTFGQYASFGNLRIGKNPLIKLFTPDFDFTSSNTINYSNILLKQLLPAMIMDLHRVFTNKKPRYIKMQKNIINNSKNLEYFSTHDWNFKTNNVMNLKSKLNDFDVKEFNFDMKDLDWNSYFKNYSLGIREHYFKEDLSKIKNDQIKETVDLQTKITI